ncbi:unnamed protein product [Boreogadus saida]
MTQRRAGSYLEVVPRPRPVRQAAHCPLLAHTVGWILEKRCNVKQIRMGSPSEVLSSEVDTMEGASSSLSAGSRRQGLGRGGRRPPGGDGGQTKCNMRIKESSSLTSE